MGGARQRGLRRLHRAAHAHRRHRGREPHRLRRPRRRQPLRHPVPDLGHDLAGVQPVRRQQPLRGRPGTARTRLQGQLQPAVHAPGASTAPRTSCSTPSTRWCAGSRRNGYDVSYFDRASTPIAAAPSCSSTRCSCRAGHDEYWSGEQRANVEAARDAGVEPRVLQRQRDVLEDPLGAEHRRHRRRRTARSSPTRRRTPNAKIDPQTRRRGRAPGATRASARRPTAAGPENALTGHDLHGQLRISADAIQVPAADGKMRFWRNTSVATLAPGRASRRSPPATLGYEWDEDLDNGVPARRVCSTCRRRRSTSPTASPARLRHRPTGTGTATHRLTLLPRRERRARVRRRHGAVGVGPRRHDTTRAARRPTSACSRRPSTCSPTWARSRRRCRPGSSRRRRRPTRPPADATITAPASGASGPVGHRSRSPGTASDAGGGVVGGVEVSIDGGATWHPGDRHDELDLRLDARRRAGPATIRARAVDDSGNLETPAPASRHRDAAADCPCIASGTTSDTPAVRPTTDSGAVELGVKFRADVAGFVTGRPLLQGRRRTPARTSGTCGRAAARCWPRRRSPARRRSGWQQVSFASPVAVAANTTYVASYHATSRPLRGRRGVLRGAGVDSAAAARAPQTASTDRTASTTYGARERSRPSSYQAANYWVDVVFDHDRPPTPTPPT